MSSQKALERLSYFQKLGLDIFIYNLLQANPKTQTKNNFKRSVPTKSYKVLIANPVDNKRQVSILRAIYLLSQITINMENHQKN